MSNYTKEDIITLVYNEGKTIWDLLELFKMSYEKEFYDTVQAIFGNDLIGYANLHSTINLNNKKYKIKHIPPAIITKEELIQMANKGKTKIDFMKLLCVETSYKLNKIIREVFKSKTGSDKFIRVIKDNTRIHFERLSA